MVVLASIGAVTQVGTHLGQRQRMRRGIDLGNDVHAKRLGVLDVLLEVGLGVPHVGGGEVGLVLAVVAALLDVGLKTEARVRLEDILPRFGVLLERNIVCLLYTSIYTPIHSASIF